MFQVYFNGEWVDCVDAHLKIKALIPIHSTDSLNIIRSGESTANNAQAYKAFDSDVNTWWQPGSSNLKGYIGYKFDSPKRVSKIKIVNIYIVNTTNARCKTFTFQYSDDGNNWYDITSTLTVSNNTNPQEFYVENSGKHMYYRVNITSTYGQAQSDAGLAELQMYGM